MGEKMIEFLQRQSDIDADNILAEVNADPEMADVHAPDEMEAALFACIDEYDMKKAHSNLSEEDRELIELGKAYKKSKKRRKYAAVASIALAGVLLSSVTAMGGPEKVIEVVRQIVLENERTYVDSQNERLEVLEGITEEEAYVQIENEFGFAPVKMHYLSKGIDFQGYFLDEETQYVNMTYQGSENRTIVYEMISNYRTGSFGRDVEDILLEVFTKEVEKTKILIKHYIVEENQEERWVLEFSENSVYYFIQMYNLNEEEVNKIIENLYFQN